MTYLLDTNVVSELTRRRPDRKVLAWFDDTDDAHLHLSVLSLGEIRKGVQMLPHGAKREELSRWLEVALPEWFETRLLAITAQVAATWGSLLADLGRPAPAIDSLLAATALHHGLAVVTRNVTDFDFPGLAVVDPWS